METKTIPKNQIVELHSEWNTLKEEMMREIEGLRTTIVVLQDKEALENIRESERNRILGKDIEEFTY